MGGLISSLAAITGVEAVLRRFLKLAVVALIGTLFLIGAVVFGLIAAYGALEAELGGIAASLVIGGALLIVAAIFLLSAALMARRAAAQPVRSTASAVAENPLLPLLGPAAGALLKRSPAVAALAAVALGFLLTRKPKP